MSTNNINNPYQFFPSPMWYNQDILFTTLFQAGILFFFFTIFGGLIVKTPYGKLTESSALNVEVMNLDPRLGWFLMELPATLSFWGWFLLVGGPGRDKPLPIFLAFLWFIHYGNRGFFFPLSIRVQPGKKSSYSLTVVLLGWVFTTLHGLLSAMWYTRVGTHLFINNNWIYTPTFWIGLIIYQISFWITIHSEHIQRNLRSKSPDKNEPAYKIPVGGAFEYITSPTYFFEILGFIGFGIMTMNPGGLVVVLVSCANLVPRAFQQHEWYLKKFENYPKNRKALIPFIV
jgi:3-oxo-5-alpha-steroid 4-dehydrogenase 1